MNHLNATTSSLSNPYMTNTTATDSRDQDVPKKSDCPSWNFFSSEKTYLIFFLVLLLGLVLLSSAANGSLLFLTVRYKQLLWQPQYIMLKNMAVCGMGMTFLTAVVALTSVVREQTLMYGSWCIAQFIILRCLFLVSQMTLALMTVERYLFICHGIHYLRMVQTGSIHLGMGLIWLFSVAASFHAAFLLSRGRRGFDQQTTGLVCDAITIKQHLGFSGEEELQVFGLPGVIMIICITVICYCYGSMYHAALRVTTALKCNNHRANRTVSFYLFIFLLQLGPSLMFVLLTVTEKRNASLTHCMRGSSLLSPLLIIMPTCINAAIPLIRNPEIKKELISVCRRCCQAKIEMTRQSRRTDEMRRHAWLVEGETPAEPERMPAPPTPPTPCDFE